MTTSDGNITGASTWTGDLRPSPKTLLRALGTAFLLAVSSPTHAMNITLSGESGAVVTGGIYEGDAQRFTTFLHQHPEVRSVYLNSPGGLTEESFWIARSIRSLGISTIVRDGAECVSACFELFAAGVSRSAGHSAKVGVHRVSFGGKEDDLSRSLSITYAKVLSTYGVPKSILASLMLQPASGMYYLTEGDLASLHVTLDRAVPYQPEARPLAYKPTVGGASVLAVKPAVPKGERE